MAGDRILVLGVGNVLMGDEGIGVHAVAALEAVRSRLAGNPEIVDGGTGGFHLLSFFKDFGTIVLIDATMDGKAAGTLSVIEPHFASDFPRSLSAHDIGLRDLIEAATLLGPLPRIYLVTVSVERLQPMSLELSAPVRQALPAVVRQVQEILSRLAPPDPA